MKMCQEYQLFIVKVYLLCLPESSYFPCKVSLKVCVFCVLSVEYK